MHKALLSESSTPEITVSVSVDTLVNLGVKPPEVQWIIFSSNT